jgi:hypothetical protein
MSDDDSKELTPPGWYEDRTSPGAVRYWNGKRWTMKWKNKPLLEGPDLIDEGAYVTIPDSAYIGGHTQFPTPGRGSLFVTGQRIALAAFDGTSIELPLTIVTSVEVTSEQVAKSKVAPVILFGVFGLGAKGSQHRTTLVVRTTDRNEAFFQFLGIDEYALRAQLVPILSKAGVPFGATADTSPSSPISVADEIRKLGELLRERLLTQEEFDAQKAKLLG